MRYHRSMPSVAAPTGPALREAKRAMRTAVMELRDALAPVERDAASAAIAARIIDLPAYAAARAILLTLPFRSEWDTRLVARDALRAGKAVIVPRVDALARVLALHRITSLDADVAPGYRGIPEPRAEAPAAHAHDVGFALVPGVAFDRTGRRLGYGGGYYDRLLPLLASGTPRVAGAFDVQMVDAVPAAAHDLAVDIIATPTRIVMPGRDG
jgi:5-formyltetrahydrofolate cyclo-ligase